MEVRCIARKSITRGKFKRNTNWGDRSNLNFNKLDSLGELASNYQGKQTPNASDFSAVLDQLDSVRTIADVDSNKRLRVDIGVAQQRKIRLSTDSQDHSGDVSVNKSQVEEVEDIQSLDSNIAKFIHVLRLSYRDADHNMLKYLQTYLQIFLNAYLKKGAQQTSLFWLVGTVQALFQFSPETFNRFSLIVSPQRLSRLYYGLHNLLRQRQADQARKSVQDGDDVQAKFRSHMQEVKSLIGEEDSLKSYLVALEDLALSHRQETITLRRRIEKMNNVNSFLPHNSQGDALRLRLYVLFDLAVVRMDDSALVAAGKSITTVTDHLLSKEVTDSSLLPGLSTIRQPIDRESTSLSCSKDSRAASLECVALLSGNVQSVTAYLEAVKSELEPTNYRLFLQDMIKLKTDFNNTHLSFRQKVERYDKIILYLPATRTDLRAILYNLYPLALTPSIVNGLPRGSRGTAPSRQPAASIYPAPIPFNLGQQEQQQLTWQNPIFTHPHTVHQHGSLLQPAHFDLSGSSHGSLPIAPIGHINSAPLSPHALPITILPQQSLYAAPPVGSFVSEAQYLNSQFSSSESLTTSTSVTKTTLPFVKNSSMTSIQLPMTMELSPVESSIDPYTTTEKEKDEVGLSVAIESVNLSIQSGNAFSEITPLQRSNSVCVESDQSLVIDDSAGQTTNPTDSLGMNFDKVETSTNLLEESSHLLAPLTKEMHPTVLAEEQQGATSLVDALEMYMQKGSQLTLGDIASQRGLDVDKLRLHINSELSYNRLMSGYYNADWAARLQQALSLLEEADSRGEMLSMQTLSKDLGLRLAVLRRLRVESQGVSRLSSAAPIVLRAANEQVGSNLAMSDNNVGGQNEFLPIVAPMEVEEVTRNPLSREADNVMEKSDSLCEKITADVPVSLPPVRAILVSVASLPQNEAIVVSVRDDSGHVMRFSVKRHFKVSKLFKAYSSQSGVDLSSICFTYRGQVLAGDTTVEAAGLNAIEVVIVTIIT